MSDDAPLLDLDELYEAHADLNAQRTKVRRTRTALGDEPDDLLTSQIAVLRDLADSLDDDARRLDEIGVQHELAATLRVATRAARATADDPSDRERSEHEARATEHLRGAIARAHETGDVAHAFDAAPQLATLDTGAYSKAKGELKAALGRKLSVRDLDRAVRDVQRKRHNAASDDGRPRIVVANQPLRDLSDDSVRALKIANRPPRLYVRGGALTRVRADEHGRPLVEALRIEHLRGELSRAANYVTPTERGDMHVFPPEPVVGDVLARGDWPMPTLIAVIETPALRPDGTVLEEPGYDAATRLVLHPAPGLSMPTIPATPTREQLDQARDLILDELLGDFPFDTEASRANALALLLTPLLRPALAGNVPLALIDAPQAGTGKGLLASLVAIIATGRPAAMMAAPQREEEWTKTILATLLGGATVVVIDNVEQRLASPALALALTADTVQGRLLGRSEEVLVPQRATWAATGNNLRLGGDLARRCYRIGLDAKHGRPWARAGFRHRDLLGWAAGHRGELIAALLTLARGWWAADQPAADVPALGGFDQWAHTTGSILAHAAVPSFLADRDQLHDQADDEAGEWAAFLTVWAEQYSDEPVSTAHIADAIRTDADGALRDALPADLADALDRPTASFKVRLGKALGKRQATRYGDPERRLERASIDARSRASLWRVVTTEQPHGDPAEVQRLQRLFPPYAGETK